MGITASRLNEIAQRLADAKSAETAKLPDVFANCWVVPGKCIAASLPHAHLFRKAEEDLEYLMELVRK